MIPISAWYDRLGHYTFPTVFIALSPSGRDALLAAENSSGEENTEPTEAAAKVIGNLQRAINSLPGRCFVGADVCAPTDSPMFTASVAVNNGRQAWEILRSSDKIRRCLAGRTDPKLTVRPYRNMNRIREFRLFVHQQKLTAMSQMNLERHFARFAKRQEYLWNEGVKLTDDIASFLPEEDTVVDIYFCSNGEILIVDMNKWGEPTDPLLLRNWDQDWDQEIGLKMIPPPINLQGNVSVSF